MGLLGTVGTLYLTLLAFLLIIGFGLTGLQLITYLFVSTERTGSKSGGKTQSNPWHRLVLLSLLSVVLMVTLLILSNPWYQSGSNHHF